ncbi:MAG: gamma-glutamylcyclotransferase family protein [Candidatus Paceibacterota bacterium]|jgi:gamma-glutamylcyclotransferase (GGCT)/AIG2-like uncharacterized protein YtfP
MIRYFAYGSNLNEDQVRERCPESKLVGKFVLKDYCLDFTIFSKRRKSGCADIVKSPGGEVWGLVYELTPNDWIEMDKFEGHPNNYKRFLLEVQDEDGDVVDAESYEVVDKSTETLMPTQEYLKLIIDGAAKHDFPQDYQKFLSQIALLDKTEVRVVEMQCWNCKKEMKIAFLDQNTSPEFFDKEAIELAGKHGVVIEERYSDTRKESYPANVCPHCDSMFGDFFLHNYWYDEPVEIARTKS